MYVFLGTWRTSRGGLGADIYTYDKETIIKKLKETAQGRWFDFSKFRYSKLNSDYCNLIKHMALEHFEEIFADDIDIFTSEEITKLFRKEISQKYGQHKLARIPKKELELGRVYTDEKGQKYIYLGKIKGSYYKPAFKSSLGIRYSHDAVTEYFEGYLLDLIFNSTNVTSIEDSLRCIKPHTTKAVGKLVGTTDIKFDVPHHYEKEHDGHILKIEFLDVKN